MPSLDRAIERSMQSLTERDLNLAGSGSQANSGPPSRYSSPSTTEPPTPSR
jgi:hypothetical protein